MPAELASKSLDVNVGRKRRKLERPPGIGIVLGVSPEGYWGSLANFVFTPAGFTIGSIGASFIASALWWAGGALTTKAVGLAPSHISSVAGTWDAHWKITGGDVGRSFDEKVTLKVRRSLVTGNGVSQFGPYRLVGTCSEFSVALTYQVRKRPNFVGSVVLSRRSEGGGGLRLEGEWVQFSPASESLVRGTTIWTQVKA